MVLGIRLTLPLLAVLAACSAAADRSAKQEASVAPAHRPVLDRMRFGQRELALIATEQGCALLVAQRHHPLGIPAPCQFLHRAGGAEPAVHDYGEHGRIVLVIGPPAPVADYPPGWAETPADRCASIGRAILERGGALALGDVTREPAGFCPAIGLDEKFYYGLAHAKPFAARELLR
jgi:hypothetical protein